MKDDILGEMTKDELVFWVRQNVWQRPSRRDMLYVRWSLGRAKLRVKCDAMPSLAEFNTQKWNDLVTAFNAAKSAAEMVKIAEELAEFERGRKAYFARDKALMREQKRLDRLYAEMQKEPR